VIGMCLTGNFAISLMAQPEVGAAVAAEPALPLGFTKAIQSALGVSTEDLERAKARTAQQTALLCLRFSGDKISPQQRFLALQSQLGNQFIGNQIDSSPENRFGIPRNAHSVLTTNFVDTAGHPTRAAFEQVLSFLSSYA
jgi:dienelactone hydrolase